MPYRAAVSSGRTSQAEAVEAPGASVVTDARDSAAGFDVVVVASSLGGRAALERVLAPLPADFPAPVLVVQHLSDRGPSLLPALLARRVHLAVRPALAGERLRAGTVYVAPPGRHLVVARDCRSGGEAEVGLCDGPRVSFARPAADRLFASAAEAFGARTLGVVLTGRLFDGAAGAAAIRAAGGVVLAQDPATCEAPDMPRAAIRRRVVDLVLPPGALGAALIGLVMVPGVPALLGLGRRVA
jgi:two-component system chemotaxis response regulator CheB